MKRTFLAVVLAVTLGMAGCGAYDTAVRVSNVVGAVLAVAQAETSQVPVADQSAFTGFVALGLTLNGQLKTCLAAANGALPTNGKFLACFNNFTTGLASPAEL